MDDTSGAVGEKSYCPCDNQNYCDDVKKTSHDFKFVKFVFLRPN